MSHNFPQDLLEPGKIEKLINNIYSQFRARSIIEPAKHGLDYGVDMKIEIADHVLWFTIVRGEEKYVATIPLPFMEGVATLLEQNGVRRAVCNYFLMQERFELSYLDVMDKIIFDFMPGLLENGMLKSKTSFIQRIAYSFENETTSIVMYQLQRAINEVVNRMPLHETPMNTWAMNQRLIIIDPQFDEIRDPANRLQYQINKATLLFRKYGWTPIGLSDGVLADKNYILKQDIRKTIPFGRRMHNPARNLYSTLGMKGDETPRIMSESEKFLADNDVSRTGWHLKTLFVDIPDVWEDQIVVSSKLAKKSITYSRRFQCFGKLQVKKGDRLKYNHVLALSEKDGIDPVKCDILADKVWVHDIIESETNVGSTPMMVSNVIVKFTRKLKDGVKITNRAANKGVIRMRKDLGYAVNPKTGEIVDIDVIVSSKAVDKRGNYTQVIEAIVNMIHGEEEKVYPDDVAIDMKVVEDQLEDAGYPRDGSWYCNTLYGELEGVFGDVFWGVTHDVEDMLWDENDTIRRNGRNIRVAGQKFSHVEFRSLITRFGKDNPIMDELMSYAQGGSDINEMIKMLEAKRGNLPDGVPVVDVGEIRPVDQIGGTITTKDRMVGSVADEDMLTEGYILRLPFEYMVMVGEDPEKKKPYVTLYEGPPTQTSDSSLFKEVHVLDKIYVPNVNLRRPWKHPSGRYGLTDIAALLNNVVVMCHRHLGDPDEMRHVEMFYRVMFRLFKSTADKMGTKRGEIATYGMSIRYPFSSKAVATLSNSLPKNVVQIHRTMAKCLNVGEGDVVLVERYPCLGFMSLRPQKVTITDDPWAKYTIRVSKNSLGSLSLDFDGDVIYLSSFHTLAAKEMLKKEWKNPNKTCYDAILELNKKMGSPYTRTLPLQGYGIKPYDPLTLEAHATIVDKLTGVKSHTGPVIALAYNIMRIVENSDIKNSKKMQVAVEMFLDRVGNSVFKQKHGFQSLHDIVIDAICCGDVETLVQNDFDRGTSTIICDTIREKAAGVGVHDLPGYHEFIKEKGGSNIINRIVREQNKIYFASRAQLEGCELLKHLEFDAVDVPSKMFRWVTSGQAETRKTPLEEYLDESALAGIKHLKSRTACKSLLECLDTLFEKKPELKEEQSGKKVVAPSETRMALMI